ncbi:hypothetical protein BGW36DRAFT_372789 [Talaromyces proteolyticus]|uniref:Uncharacterized protein n=1 Tax=Talaromyces proteolyticus TaxID=1131652 RepID=A0AAD4Q417_9EURO|nr:uncharacterized protein BGW36DRAFT_372789 [Talaromyces proteolyticus]KAH8702398.1 hypothetical protein BGW36DRAFT_372789 [Talaromyces proteolyticus]
MPEQQRPSVSQHAASFQSGVNLNPSSSSYLRQRPLGRAATFADAGNSSSFRRNSAISDTVSEARQSLRDSTDDILFPRADKGENIALHHDDSHWQSAPLALALLPAVGGLFFQNGSAFITDATLLILAAIFLNWSVRLPWDWYRSAQEVRQQSTEEFLEDINEEENEDGSEAHEKSPRKDFATASHAATKELHKHEFAALISCFVFPLIGAWLLHTIRGALSRPSEGLVSNYNLTIFLLAAEIRPFAHLLRMVQARTLYLQRIVAAPVFDDDAKIDETKVIDLARRLEELEAHVADKAIANSSQNANEVVSPDQADSTAQLVAEVHKAIQPELDALTRAVRRYEKRTALIATQTDARLNELETQVGDAIALAAAAQRSISDRHQSFALIFLDWISAIVVIPVQTLIQLINLPARTASWCLNSIKVLLMGNRKLRKINKGKKPQARTAAPLRRTSPSTKRNTTLNLS